MVWEAVMGRRSRLTRQPPHPRHSMLRWPATQRNHLRPEALAGFKGLMHVGVESLKLGEPRSEADFEAIQA